MEKQRQRSFICWLIPQMFSRASWVRMTPGARSSHEWKGLSTCVIPCLLPSESVRSCIRSGTAGTSSGTCMRCCCNKKWFNSVYYNISAENSLHVVLDLIMWSMVQPIFMLSRQAMSRAHIPLTLSAIVWVLVFPSEIVLEFKFHYQFMRQWKVFPPGKS